MRSHLSPLSDDKVARIRARGSVKSETRGCSSSRCRASARGTAAAATQPKHAEPAAARKAVGVVGVWPLSGGRRRCDEAPHESEPKSVPAYLSDCRFRWWRRALADRAKRPRRLRPARPAARPAHIAPADEPLNRGAAQRLASVSAHSGVTGRAASSTGRDWRAVSPASAGRICCSGAGLPRRGVTSAARVAVKIAVHVVARKESAEWIRKRYRPTIGRRWHRCAADPPRWRSPG